MKYLEDLKETLGRELDEIASKGEMSAGDLETVDKLTNTLKNVCKLMEEYGYSEYGGEWEGQSYARGGNGGGSNRGGGNRGGSGGGYSYARGRGRNARRDSMGRYSRADAKEEMIEKLEQMMNEADDERTRKAIERCINQVEMS